MCLLLLLQELCSLETQILGEKANLLHPAGLGGRDQGKGREDRKQEGRTTSSRQPQWLGTEQVLVLKPKLPNETYKHLDHADTQTHTSKSNRVEA